MKAERRKELKHHDEFADTLAWLWQIVKERQRDLLTGAVAALVLVGAVLYIVERRNRARDTAWATLASIDDSVEQSRYAEPKSPDARTEAIEKYKKLAEDYPRSSVAPMALFRAGKLLQEIGKLEEAQKILDTLLHSYPQSELAAAAQSAKAGVFEDMGKYAEARTLYEKVAQTGPKYLSIRAYLGAARCAELGKDVSHAKTLYQKVIALAPGSTWAQLAEERIKSLSAQTVSTAKNESAPPASGSDKKGSNVPAGKP